MFHHAFVSDQDPYSIRVRLMLAKAQENASEARRLQRIWESFAPATRTHIETAADLGG